MAKQIETNTVNMTIGEHLEELRARLIWALVGIVAAACVMLFFGRSVIDVLCVPLKQTQSMFGLLPQTFTHGVPTAFTIYLKVSLIGGLILASPWVVYQIWRFVAAGMYKYERRVIITVIPFSAAMTVAGVLFMYSIMLPVCLWFFFKFATSYPEPGSSEPGFVQRLLIDTIGPEKLPTTTDDTHTAATVPDPLLIPVLSQEPSKLREGQMWIIGPEKIVRVHVNGHTISLVPSTKSLMSPLIEIGQYISFVTVLAIGVAVAFQLPVVMLVLGWTGLVRADLIVQYRRHCVFGCFVLGALLTPSDVPSMFLLALPLWGLFELGLLLMRLTERRREQDDSTMHAT